MNAGKIDLGKKSRDLPSVVLLVIVLVFYAVFFSRPIGKSRKSNLLKE